MTDLSTTIAPKSDQVNADDLIAGPRTIRITSVKASATPEQPISVHFEGDDGKPYKPCKSMRRLMVAMWGANGNAYTGRSLTLYNDPKVKWGGIEVGGIRISHMSHIDSDTTMALTESKTKRVQYKVRKLEVKAQEVKRDEPKPTPDAEPYPIAQLLTAIENAATLADARTLANAANVPKEHRAEVKAALEDKAAWEPRPAPKDDVE